MTITPEQLVKAISEHKNFLGEYAALLDKEYTMYALPDENGDLKQMTPRDWEMYFRVEMPSSPSPEELLSLQSKVITLFDTAMFYLAHSQLIVDTFDEGASEKLDQALTTLVKTHDPTKGRLPAAATLRAIANAENENLVGGQAAAIARLNFWKTMVKKLERQVKLMEEARWTMHIDAKHINDGRGEEDGKFSAY